MAAEADPPRVVWGREDIALDTCPKSFITAESVSWVEEFLVRKKLGFGRVEELGARQAEAFLILDGLLAKPGTGNEFPR